jgi:hypothetical protein
MRPCKDNNKTDITEISCEGVERTELDLNHVQCQDTLQHILLGSSKGVIQYVQGL